MGITVKPGDSLPLSLLLFDGDEGKFPSAHVYKEDFTPVAGSPFPLSHLAHGLYKNTSAQAPASAKVLTAVYVVYDNPERTQVSETHTRSEDKFVLQDIAPSQYLQKMSTTLRADGTQEVIVWAEKNGERFESAQNCTVSVKDSLGVQKWTAQQESPNTDGVFRFTNPIQALDNSNYYIVVSMNIEGRQRVFQQAFMAIG